jgi:hypothetical protein
MIVRISSEGQYDLDDGLHARLNDLDDAVVAAVEASDQAGFHAAFEELLRFVRTEGRRHDDDDLAESDFILPPADTSFEEAGEDFTGEGLIPEPA